MKLFKFKKSEKKKNDPLEQKNVSASNDLVTEKAEVKNPTETINIEGHEPVKIMNLDEKDDSLKNEIKQDELVDEIKSTPNSKNTLKLVFDDHDGSPTLSEVNSLKYVIDNYKTDNFKKPKNIFVKLDETNVSLKDDDKKLDLIAIIEKEDLNELNHFIDDIELNSNKLYSNLEEIPEKLFELNQEQKKEISTKVRNFSREVDNQLDLMKSVIYNIEADWNPELIAKNIRDYIYSPNHLNNKQDNLETQKNNNELLEALLNTDAKLYVEQSSNANMQANFKNIYLLVNFIKHINEKIAFGLSEVNDLLNNQNVNKKFLNLILELVVLSSKVNDSFNEFANDLKTDISEQFNQLQSAYEKNLKNLKQLRSIPNLDQKIYDLNNDLVQWTLNRDNLMTKLAILYNAVGDNIKLLNQKEFSELNEESFESSLFNENSCYVCKDYHSDDFEKLNVIADDTKLKKFNKFLTRKYHHYLKGKSYARLRLFQRKYTYDQYVHFLATEAGIISDLKDLFNLLEKERLHLLLKISVNQVESRANQIDSLSNLLENNFLTVKILASELLVLRTLSVHLSLIEKIKERAYKKTPDYMQLVVWDKYLDNEIKDAREKISELFNNEKYKHDLSVQYLYHALNEMKLWYEEEQGISRTSSDKHNLFNVEKTAQQETELVKIVNYILDANNELIQHVEFVESLSPVFVENVPTEPQPVLVQSSNFAFDKPQEQPLNQEWNLEVQKVISEEECSFEFGKQEPAELNTYWGDFYPLVLEETQNYEIPSFDFAKAESVEENLNKNWNNFASEPKKQDKKDFAFGEQEDFVLDTNWGEFDPIMITPAPKELEQFEFGEQEESALNKNWGAFEQPENVLEESQQFEFGEQEEMPLNTKWNLYGPEHLHIPSEPKENLETKSTSNKENEEIKVSDSIEFDYKWVSDTQEDDQTQYDYSFGEQPVSDVNQDWSLNDVKENPIESFVQIDDSVIKGDFDFVLSDIEIYEEEPEEITLRRLELKKMSAAGMRIVEMIKFQKNVISKIDAQAKDPSKKHKKLPMRPSERKARQEAKKVLEGK